MLQIKYQIQLEAESPKTAYGSIQGKWYGKSKEMKAKSLCEV